MLRFHATSQRILPPQEISYRVEPQPQISMEEQQLRQRQLPSATDTHRL